MAESQRFLLTNMNSNTTTVIKSGAAFLHTITFNKKGSAANTLTIYDNTAASGTVIALIDTTAVTPGTSMFYDGCFTMGITAIMATGTAADVTFSFE